VPGSGFGNVRAGAVLSSDAGAAVNA
jgi:hypothetical protein